MKTKLGIVGCGFLGNIVADAWKKGLLPDYELVGVTSRTRASAEKTAANVGCAVCEDMDALLALEPEYIVEAASVESVRAMAIPVLNRGVNLVILSIGAFKEESVMFEKLVAIEPVSLIPSAEEELHRYAKEVVLYRDVPASDDEMVRRIGDADAVLLSYTSRMGKEVIAQCPNIRYIGMCCSLYSEESANVDIAYARTRGIQVLGIRDYGDRGVVEYVLHELTGLLHGFGMPMLRDEPVEITGLKVGIVGLGVSGRMIADALQFMGAEISYFARSTKPDAEAAGMTFKPLAQLLAESEVVFTCLNKNVLLLGENEFAQLGAGKVLFNTSIGPGFDSAALEKWLDLPGTHFFCDTRAAAGPVAEDFFARENVRCANVSAGRTKQAFVLLSKKVLDNIRTALGE